MLSSFLDISEVNQQATYSTRSTGENISQYIGYTREAQIRPVVYPNSISQQQHSDQTNSISQQYIPTTTHHSALQKEKVRSKKQQQFTCATHFNITFHFYFLLRLFISNLKIISSYHSTINLYMDSMAAESFVEPRTVLGSVKSCEIYRRYIGAGCTRSALARQLI